MANRRTDGRLSDDRLARYGAAVLVGFVLVGGALVLGSVVFGGSDDRPAASSLAETASPTGLPSSASPTAAPSTASTEGLTADAMTGFLTTYLKKVADSPAEAWIMLTPDFQTASGGFAKYSAFWGKVALATPTEVLADPATGTISYRVSYVYADGTTGNDRTRLVLVDNAGTLLISAEG